jgi:TPP-dependent pyruvate/acetoin dehydrogenase alpha subunit
MLGQPTNYIHVIWLAAFSDDFTATGGFAMPGVRVKDGQDVLAIYGALKAAADAWLKRDPIKLFRAQPARAGRR